MLREALFLASQQAELSYNSSLKRALSGKKFHSILRRLRQSGMIQGSLKAKSAKGLA
jgi:hypothetical protein